MANPDLETTREQLDAIAEQDERWQKEKEWPVFEVNLAGDEIEWEFRDHPDYYDKSGRPRTGAKDEDGNLLPGHAERLRKVAACSTRLHAQSKDQAAARALTDNPEYHTVVEVREITDAPDS
jgi:hypothetical protein